MAHMDTWLGPTPGSNLWNVRRMEAKVRFPECRGEGGRWLVADATMDSSSPDQGNSDIALR
ncbi:hypothetical protein N7510_011765 [Penicillium lagena]|uniref:uncharacterized protein n=1 Tax=Penicillium lagena TaxID=94218 RepID=UPI00253FA535|nr:uncharacterized protein N7510_011765 [Penicillium lagena]KAJ5602231.1 hypothetical protein N7510_011765 [Penicillium lagena]